MQGQLQQVIQREELVNLTLPLNMFMGAQCTGFTR